MYPVSITNPYISFSSLTVWLFSLPHLFPGITPQINSLSRGAQTSNNKILCHLYISAKTYYGDTSQRRGSQWGNNRRGLESFWMLAMFPFLSRMMFKQACSFCKSPWSCMLKAYMFYYMYTLILKIKIREGWDRRAAHLGVSGLLREIGLKDRWIATSTSISSG